VRDFGGELAALSRPGEFPPGPGGYEQILSTRAFEARRDFDDTRISHEGRRPC
jgi:hypothetical protein